MKITENFLNNDDFQRIKETMLSGFFPWFYSKGISYQLDPSHQFVHNFYSEDHMHSNYFYLLKPFLDKLNIRSLIRIKANFLSKTEKIIEHSFHVDNDVVENTTQKTAVFYLNTNNGYTLFKNNNKKIKSEENKIIVFNSKEQHAGTTCTDEEYRIVINFNFFDRDS